LTVAVEFYSSDHRAGLRVNRRDVVRPVVVGEHAFGARIVVNPVGAFADVNLLDEFQRGRIEDRDLSFRPVAGDSVYELRRKSNPVTTSRNTNGVDHPSVVGVHDIPLSSV